jgi:hypothetical protein
MDSGANHLVGVMALVQRLECIENSIDMALFQQRAHALEPLLLLLGLWKTYCGWGHEFPSGMCPIHNFHDREVCQGQIAPQRRDTIPNPTCAVSYND